MLEVCFKLKNNVDYYAKLLMEKGFINNYNVNTHDIYFSNINLNELSEYDMKKACIRLRSVNNKDYIVQNDVNSLLNTKVIKKEQLQIYVSKLQSLGYKKIFDTLKKDHHYKNIGNIIIQLQEIDNIGLLVYYDNDEYSKYDLDVQKKKLVSDLNSFGFNIQYEELCLDKLRTLYYGKEMYS